MSGIEKFENFVFLLGVSVEFESMELLEAEAQRIWNKLDLESKRTEDAVGEAIMLRHFEANALSKCWRCRFFDDRTMFCAVAPGNIYQMTCQEREV